MVKEFQDNQRGAGGFRGGNRGRGGNSRGRGGFGGGNRGNFDNGPPSYVIPYGTFLHRSQNKFVVKCTDMTRFPKFNRGVYLESKAKIGSVDEILGPLNAFYFSVIPAEGVNPASFKADQVFYMNPEDLLSTDRFTRPQAQKPKGPRREGGARPATGGFRPQGGRGDGNFRGQPRGRGNFGGRGQFNRR